MVVAAGNARRIELDVVHAARGRVDPAVGDALENDLGGRDERDDQVHGHDGVEAGPLPGGPGEPVEYEARGGVLRRRGLR